MIGVQFPLPQFDTFQIGSAFNYVKNVTDTAIHGSLLYEAALPAPIWYGTAAFEFRISLDSTLGAFQFGEVGLFSDSGQLIDLAVSNVQLYKFPSTNTQSGNSFILSILYVLDPSTNTWTQYVNFYEYGNVNLSQYVPYSSPTSDNIVLRSTNSPEGQTLGTVLDGVASGQVAAGSKQAINGDQFFAYEQSVSSQIASMNNTIQSQATLITSLTNRLNQDEAVIAQLQQRIT